MKISIGKFFRNKSDFDNANIICPIEFFNRDKYLNLRLLIRVLFISLFGFGFGYSIYFNISSTSDLKVYLISFALLYFFIFYLIQIPHEFIHAIFYKNPFKDNINKLLFFNKKRLLTSELTQPIKGYGLFLSLISPFFIFTIIPLIAICIIGFNLNLFALSFANAILSSEDLLNIILQLISGNNNGYKSLFVIPNNYDYLLNVDSNNNTNNIDYTSNESIIHDNFSDDDFDIDQLEQFSSNISNILEEENDEIKNAPNIIEDIEEDVETKVQSYINSVSEKNTNNSNNIDDFENPVSSTDMS